MRTFKAIRLLTVGPISVLLVCVYCPGLDFPDLQIMGVFSFGSVGIEGTVNYLYRDTLLHQTTLSTFDVYFYRPFSGLHLGSEYLTGVSRRYLMTLVG